MTPRIAPKTCCIRRTGLSVICRHERGGGRASANGGFPPRADYHLGYQASDFIHWMKSVCIIPRMKIWGALVEDAPAACEVLRRSISELCVADHRNDATILAQWLANKTPDIVASWILQPNNSVLVAVEDGIILGVGSVTDKGEINLNYV